jgi:hypothetical protein
MQLSSSKAEVIKVSEDTADHGEWRQKRQIQTDRPRKGGGVPIIPLAHLPLNSEKRPTFRFSSSLTTPRPVNGSTGTDGGKYCKIRKRKQIIVLILSSEFSPMSSLDCNNL